MGGRPGPHVRGARPPARLAGGDAVHPAVRDGRHPRGDAGRQSPRGVVPAQVRGRPPPGAAGPRHREPGSRPHQRGDRGDPARGRGARRRPRSQRPRDRRVPLQRARRPVGEHHRLRGADHPRADRRGRDLPGREEPAPEQGQGAADLAVAAAATRTGTPGGRAVVGSSQPGPGGGRSEKVRTYNFKENRVTDHRVGVTVHALDQVLAGGEPLDELADALAAAERAAQLGGDG